MDVTGSVGAGASARLYEIRLETRRTPVPFQGNGLRRRYDANDGASCGAGAFRRLGVSTFNRSTTSQARRPPIRRAPRTGEPVRSRGGAGQRPRGRPMRTDFRTCPGAKKELIERYNAILLAIGRRGTDATYATVITVTYANRGRLLVEERPMVTVNLTATAVGRHVQPRSTVSRRRGTSSDRHSTTSPTPWAARGRPAPPPRRSWGAVSRGVRPKLAGVFIHEAFGTSPRRTLCTEPRRRHDDVLRRALGDAGDRHRRRHVPGCADPSTT